MYQVHKYIYPLSCVISFAYVHVEVTIGYTKLDSDVPAGAWNLAPVGIHKAQLNHEVNEAPINWRRIFLAILTSEYLPILAFFMWPFSQRTGFGELENTSAATSAEALQLNLPSGVTTLDVAN